MVDNRLNPRFFETADDPAYQESLEEASKRSAELIGKFAQPFYKVTTPEEPLKQQIAETEATNKKLLQEAQPQIQAIQQMQPGSRDTLLAIGKLEEDLKSKGYRGLNLQEIIGRTGQFLYGDQRRAFEKMAAGQPLTQEDRDAAILAPLDTLDFIIPGFATKYAGIGLKNVKDVLDSTIDRPEIRQIKALFGEASPGMVKKDLLTLGLFPEGASQQAGNIQRQIDAYGYLVPAWKKFTESVKGTEISRPQFAQFLKENNIKLNTPGGIDADKAHIAGAVKFLNKNISGDKFELKSMKFGAPGGEWRDQTKKILEELPEGQQLNQYKIKEALLQSGVRLPKVFEPNFIARFKNVLAKEGQKDLADKIKVLDFDEGRAENVFNEFKKLEKQLNDGTLQKGLGQNKYTITGIDGKKQNLATALRYSQKTSTKPGSDFVPFKTRMADRNVDQLIENIKELTFTPKEVSKDFYYRYLPSVQKASIKDKEFNEGLQRLFDQNRAGGVLPSTKEGFENLMERYGIVEKTDPNDRTIGELNKPKIEQLIADVDYINGVGASRKAEYKKLIDDSLDITNYTHKKFDETVKSSPALQDQIMKMMKEEGIEVKKFDEKGKAIKDGDKFVKGPVENIDEAINFLKQGFTSHLSHIYKLKDFKKGKKGLSLQSSDPRFIRLNFGEENLAFQNIAENTIDRAIDTLSKNIKPGQSLDQILSRSEKDPVRNALSNLLYYHENLQKKGMAAYRRYDKKKLSPEVISLINDYLTRRATNINESNRAGFIKQEGIDDKISEKFNDLFLGAENPQTPDQIKARFDDLMNFYLQNPKELKFYLRSPEYKEFQMMGYKDTPYKAKYFLNTHTPKIEQGSLYRKGGAVRMARGGDPMIQSSLNAMEGMNSYPDFASDPAFQGEDYFQQAVDSGNLYAFNPFRLFKQLGKVPAVATPSNQAAVEGAEMGKKAIDQPSTIGTAVGEVLPSKNDFMFQSDAINFINNPNAPKAARPQDWLNEFKGKVKEAELRDSGMLQYLQDYANFFPQGKLTREDLIKVYENSPIGSMEVRIKTPTNTSNFINQEEGLMRYQGDARHENAGSNTMDRYGEKYREIVLNAKNIEGEKYVNSMHYNEPNVIGFARVADFKTPDGNMVPTMMEVQTDMLTEVKKQQELTKALAEKVRLVKSNYETKLASPNTILGERDYYLQELAKLENKYPEDVLQFLETTSLISPSKPAFMDELAPQVTEKLTQIQNQIDNLGKANRPFIQDENYLEKITALQEEGKKEFNRLFELNRQADFEEKLKDIRVPQLANKGELQKYLDDVRDVEAGVYRNLPVKTFPQIPFNKPADYLDLLVKSTIKDAQNRGLNKIAVMSSDNVNRRWGKSIDAIKPGEVGHKFHQIYDVEIPKVMKNIQKKYGGTFEKEIILDESKPPAGIIVYKKDLDTNTFTPSNDTLVEALEASGSQTQGQAAEQLNDYIIDRALDFPEQVIVSKEISPNVFQDFKVKVNRNTGDNPDAQRDGTYRSSTGEDSYELVPATDADMERARFQILDYNPQEKRFWVYTMPESGFIEPMKMFGKKDGGKVKRDSLVSITDIYGDY